MAKKVIDRSPKFDKSKNYAIGVLIQNAAPSDVPERFSSNPKPLYLSGTDLLGVGVKSCRDFLISDSCYFKVGSAVHFYEVEYHENNDAPVYKNIFIGSPLVSQAVTEQGLSDKTQGNGHTINNIIPNSNASEHEKMLFKTQSESISYYQKCLQDERKEFANERNIYSVKINEQNDRILELNLLINTLKAENEALKIKYEEATKFADRLERMGMKEDEEEEPQGLADKGIAMLDGMLGDGASQQIVTGLANGIGQGLGKLLDLGVDILREKGFGKKPTEAPPQQVVQPVVNPLMMPMDEMQQAKNIERLKEQLQYTN